MSTGTMPDPLALRLGLLGIICVLAVIGILLHRLDGKINRLLDRESK